MKKGGQSMEHVMSFASILVPIVAALVNLIKKSISLPKKVIPSISFAVGLLIGGIAYPFTEMDFILRLWSGGIAGLAATGLYETIFNQRPGMTKDKKK
jgi:hypothetical protein